MEDVQPPRPPASLLLGVALTAFVLRLLHVQSLLADPLFYQPLGGNAPYLLMAERIAAGGWAPEGAFTVNSPLYPYLVAAVYKTFGVGSLYAVRLLAVTADAFTAVGVAVLAFRHFGLVAGWSAGLAMAVYGPTIFFAGELAPVPFTLLLLVGGIILLDGRGAAWRFGLAGLLLGLATGMRPNLLLAGLLALAVPWARGLSAPGRLAAAVAAGLVVGLAPVTALNAAGSGGFTLLTLSGGHNLYIGHNPMAEPQYALPTALDGDVFASMKSLAEEAEGRAFQPHEVSGYYARRALGHVVRNPGHAASLTARRALLLANDFEATTYANPDYHRWYSPVLRLAPGFAWLLALALPGTLLMRERRRLHLWIPLLVAALSVFGFFYIARLRIVMVPTLAVCAGASVAWAVERWREGARRTVAAGALLALAGFGLAKLPLLDSDPSNDWNKAAGVLRVMGRHAEAAAALDRARTANPANPNTYLNLAALLRDADRTEEAAAAASVADSLLRAAELDRADFLEAVRSR